MAEHNHVREGAGHREATVVNRIIKDEGAEDPRPFYSGDHASLRVAGDHKMSNPGELRNGVLENSNSFRRVTRS